MTKQAIPHFRARPAAGGLIRYSWEPAPGLIKAGWPTVPLGLSNQVKEHAARDLAVRINGMVQDWRAGKITEVPDVILNLKLVANPGKPAGKRLARAKAPPGTCAHMIDAYLSSRKYERLAEATRISYRSDCEFLRRWCGDLPVAGVTPKACKKLYETLFDGLPARKGKEAVPGLPRRAQKIIIMGRTVWKWALSEELATMNPWMAVETETPVPALPDLWENDDVDTFVQVADALGEHGIGTAVRLNAWLGQRVSDVREWDRNMMKGGRLWVVQRKTKARVGLPLRIVPALVQRLEEDAARQARAHITSTRLVSTSDGLPFTESSMRNAFNRVRAEAAKVRPGIAALDMMHLRHTAVTRLGEAGCTPQQIAAISGHSLKSITLILERYNIITNVQADDAFEARMKMEAGGNRQSDDDAPESE